MLHRSLALLALAGFLTCAAAADDGALRVTYIANEGFLIQAGGMKVAVDAFFHGATINWCHAPEPGTVERMASASPPFDDIDLILVTHWHSDHFTPQLVLDHLSTSAGTHLIASPQAVTKLRELPGFAAGLEARIHELDLELFGRKELSLGGIRVEAHRIRHGAYPLKDEKTGETRNKHEDVENLAFLVEMGGATFAHFGDAFLRENLDYLNGKRFPGRRVDLAFLEGWSDETLAVLKERLDPRAVVFMHMPPEPERIERIAAHVASKLPVTFIFRTMLESRSFP